MSVGNEKRPYLAGSDEAGVILPHLWLDASCAVRPPGNDPGGVRGVVRPDSEGGEGV